MLEELRSPGVVGSREAGPYVQMLNIKCDDIDWAPEKSFIYIFEHSPAADWLRWKSAVCSWPAYKSVLVCVRASWLHARLLAQRLF